MTEKNEKDYLYVYEIIKFTNNASYGTAIRVKVAPIQAELTKDIEIGKEYDKVVIMQFRLLKQDLLKHSVSELITTTDPELTTEFVK